MPKHKERVLIIGGGIAGLTTAYRLQQWAGETVEWRLIERDHRLGGKIRTAREDGFVIEAGPDSFHAQKPATIELCHELGLADDVIGPNTASGSTLIWSRGRLRAMPEAMSLVPSRIGPFLRSSLISWPGKLRMGMEAIIPPRMNGFEDESIAAFVRRRLGNEAVEKIAAPLMAGIHAGDVEKLSLRSTFPRFHDIEREYGGLMRAVWARKRQRTAAKPSPPYFSLKGGVQQLVDALVGALDPARIDLGRHILGMRRVNGSYRLFVDGAEAISADRVVFATPASATAYILEDLAPRLAEKLRELRSVSTATVSLGFRQSDIGRVPSGSGYVVANDRRGVLGCTWSSNKFLDRAPRGHVLVRVFIGGSGAEDCAEQDNERLVARARQEVNRSLGVAAEPILTKVYRWPKSHPQYEIGHQERVAEIEHLVAQYPGMYLAGAAYRGVGIPDCIQSGDRVAGRIARAASSKRSSIGSEEELLPHTL